MSLQSKLSILVTACIVLALWSETVEAWNCAGHMITTEIALQVVPPHVRRYFSDMSAYQQMYFPKITSLTEASCWPDDMKSYTKQYSTWHYYDMCLLRANGTNVTCPTIPEGDMVVAVASARSALAAAVNLTAAERGFWLSFLVHLVGDFHQPLHVTTLFSPQFPQGDLGGNRFYIYVNGSKTNLHSFHDDLGWLLPSGFPDRPLAEYPTQLSMIEGLSASLLNQSFAYPNQPNVTNTNVWLEEGFETGSTVSYSLPDGAPLPFNEHFMINSTYVGRLRSTLQNKLALGGRRLAAILLEIYSATHQA